MKLTPVYLVAPEPDPPSMPTRRAFLIAGSTFAAGLGLGGACGFAAGASGAPAKVQPASGDVGEPVATQDASMREGPIEWESSGDALLEELRRLAVKAPIEELFQKRHDFVELVGTTYADDTIVWRGIGRLAQETLEREQMDDRRLFARWLAQYIENGDRECTKPYLGLIPKLRNVQ